MKKFLSMKITEIRRSILWVIVGQRGNQVHHAMRQDAIVEFHTGPHPTISSRVTRKRACSRFITALQILQPMICISRESCSDQTPRTLPTWLDPLHQ